MRIETIIEEEKGPLCQCGCGGHLPVGSRRKFKNGHARAFNRTVERAFLEQNDPTKGINLAPSNPAPSDGQQDNTSGQSDSQFGNGNPFERLRDQIDDDPDAVHPEAKASDIPNLDKVPKNVQDDIEGKIAFVLGMSGSMLVVIDPVCMPVFNQQIPQITKALVPLVCKSPQMVDFFVNKGGFFLWLNLGAATWPVIQVVIAHHLTKKIEMQADGKIYERDMSMYRAR